jgi:soluble lytic murein transglycosylase-like protein
MATLPGLSRLFNDLAHRTVGEERERAAAALLDFEQVVQAVSGSRTPLAAHTFDDYRAAFAGGVSVAIPVDRDSASRDDTAYRLHSLGYSPKEIADILAGRITKAALDTAQKMLMVGFTRERVSNFLDREYRRLELARTPKVVPKAPPSAPPRTPRAIVRPAELEALATRMAAEHGVDPALVRAVIDVESAWTPQIVSKAGAIGLMQLMPSTARTLGVDPFNPAQNIEGGVRFMASLLATFKNVEHALIAYNAGPGFTERFLRGETALYGETRDFVTKVLGRMKQ